MPNKDINEIKINNSIHFSLPQEQEKQIKENIGYNCSECSSLIEILSIDENENNIEFKCLADESHNNKLNINNYLEKMTKYIDKKI